MKNVTIQEDQFDAVVFHDPTWWDYQNRRPASRSPHQLYVYWNQESPSIHSRPDEWDKLAGFFNRTMTHRWDSDIPHPYGWIVPIHPESIPLHPEPALLQRLMAKAGNGKVNYAAGKTKMAAWFVSHCNTPSGRDEYVRRLQRYVDVEVFGRCGTLNCSKSDNYSCRLMMERNYKFHISFENSLCLDYVTEKFFEQVKLESFNLMFISFD